MQLPKVNTQNPFVIAGGLLLLVVIVFLVGRWTKRKHDRSGEIIEAEKKLRQQYGNEISTVGLLPEELSRDADRLRVAFGWGVAAFGWNAWTEDEQTIISVIRKYSFNQFPYLAGAYNMIVKRDLSNDVKEYLSDSEYGQIAHIVNT